MIVSSICNGGARLSGEESMEIRKMMEHKRCPYSVDETSLSSLTTKRQKADFSISSKEGKEKLGEKINALQQLVSPYGKTDTASVLLEAMEYIQFLHEQVKVLSAPYLQSSPMGKNNILVCSLLSSSTFLFTINDSREMKMELELCSLRSRGLCIVPVSCTVGVARSNGADIWAPAKSTLPEFEKSISQFR